MSVIIGVTGFKRTGKSEVRKHLVQVYGFSVVPMAAPLKAMLAAGFGLSEDQLNGSLKESPAEQLLGATPRLAMQTLGTEWGRMMIHSEIWVHQWKMRVLNTGRHVVADDVRFPNEVATVRSLGGKILRVVRPGTGATDHPSEREMEDIEPDYSIANIGTIADLRRNIDKALRVLGVSR